MIRVFLLSSSVLATTASAQQFDLSAATTAPEFNVNLNAQLATLDYTLQLRVPDTPEALRSQPFFTEDGRKIHFRMLADPVNGFIIGTPVEGLELELLQIIDHGDTPKFVVIGRQNEVLYNLKEDDLFLTDLRFGDYCLTLEKAEASTLPLIVSLAVDISGSMTGALADVRQSLVDFAQDLPPRATCEVVMFDHALHYLDPPRTGFAGGPSDVPSTPLACSVLAAAKKEKPINPSGSKKSSQAAKSAASEGFKSEPRQNKPFGRELELEHEHPFLIERGIEPELAETYGIGFCDAGIMKGRIAIPIHNLDGEILAYAGRYASEDIPDGTDRYRFPKRFLKSLELYNLHRAVELRKRYLVIVEGYWSAIRLNEAGIPAAALMGTTISHTQAELVREAGFRHAILLLDGDKAGREAASEAAFVLSQHVYVRTMELPDGAKPDTVSEDFLNQFR